MWGGTVPLLSVNSRSDSRVPKRAVGSAGMGWRGGVVDGGRVVGTSGGAQMDTCTQEIPQKTPTRMKLNSLNEKHTQFVNHWDGKLKQHGEIKSTNRTLENAFGKSVDALSLMHNTDCIN